MHENTCVVWWRGTQVWSWQTRARIMGLKKKKDPSTMEIFRGINSAGTSWVASGPFLNPAAQENFFLLQYLGGGPP